MISNVFLASTKAQSYSFDVYSEVVNIYIENDGSITIEYWINFFCHYGARSIDYVDIGFPNEHYDIESVKADIEGESVFVRGPSPYVEIGVEIYLGVYAIRPGTSRQLHVIGNNPKMIYEDWEDQTLASVEFSPTWFDYCDIFEYLEVNFYFPENLTDGNEVKYHYEEYTSFSWDADGDLIYTWTKEEIPMQQYMYGVSFPKKYVDQYIPWSGHPQLVNMVILILLAIGIIGFIGGGAFLIYRYYKNYKTRYYPPKPKKNPGDYIGSICCVGFLGASILFIFWAFAADIILIGLLFIASIAGFGMIGVVLFKLIQPKIAKLPYSKPDIKIDSLGVNKNLTVIEAAIIQNIPLSKVIFLIIFSLIRTGHLKIIGVEPLRFEVISTKGVSKMRSYQRKFLGAVINTGPNIGPVNQTKLKKLLVDLIKATYKKMSGYKLEATIYYYQNMIDKAWKTVNKWSSDVKWEEIEKEYEWMVLDEEFEEKSERYLVNRYYYRPYWYHHYYYHNYFWYHRPYYRYYTGGTRSMAPAERINIHTFSDSIVRGIENLSNNIVSNFTSFAEKIITIVAPVRPGSGGRGRGGRSRGGGYRSGGGCACACACACAGCACACAGGGR